MERPLRWSCITAFRTSFYRLSTKLAVLDGMQTASYDSCRPSQPGAALAYSLELSSATQVIANDNKTEEFGGKVQAGSTQRYND